MGPDDGQKGAIGLQPCRVAASCCVFSEMPKKRMKYTQGKKLAKKEKIASLIK